MNKDNAKDCLPLVQALPEAGSPVSVSERERFESWALSTGFDVLEISRLSDGQYYSLNVQVGWQAWQAARRLAGESIGTVGSMPGTNGFTMACFKADEVPAGTRLYAGPPQQPERVDLEQFRQAVLDQFDLARQEETWSRHSRIKMQAAEAERDLLLAIIDSQGREDAL